VYLYVMNSSSGGAVGGCVCFIGGCVCWGREKVRVNVKNEKSRDKLTLLGGVFVCMCVMQEKAQ